MQVNTARYKINYQTKQNIHDILSFYTVQKKKWKFLFKKKLIKFENEPKPKLVTVVASTPMGFTDIKPKSIKLLYKNRLINCQKFKSFYNLSAKKLKSEFKDIHKSYQCNTIDKLILTLETYLNIVLLRSRLFLSIHEINQKITHGNICVNGVTVKSIHYKLKPGDVILIVPKIQKYKNGILPNYLEWNLRTNMLVLLKNPKLNQIEYSFSLNKTLILEYLTKL